MCEWLASDTAGLCAARLSREERQKDHPWGEIEERLRADGMEVEGVWKGACLGPGKSSQKQIGERAGGELKRCMRTAQTKQPSWYDINTYGHIPGTLD